MFKDWMYKYMYKYYIKDPLLVKMSDKWNSFKNDGKYFLVHVKSSFCSWDIYIFVLA